MNKIIITYRIFVAIIAFIAVTITSSHHYKYSDTQKTFTSKLKIFGGHK